MSSWAALEERLGRSPLLWPALGLLIGVGLTPLAPPIRPWLLAPLGVMLLLAAIRRPGVLPLAAALLLLVTGIIRAQAVGTLAPSDISAFNGRFVELRGVVAEEPDVRERSSLLRVAVQATVGGSRYNPIWQRAGGTRNCVCR